MANPTRRTTNPMPLKPLNSFCATAYAKVVVGRKKNPIVGQSHESNARLR